MDWTLDFADSDWAIGLLTLAAFSESVVFPIPPDPLLIQVRANRACIILVGGQFERMALRPSRHSRESGSPQAGVWAWLRSNHQTD